MSDSVSPPLVSVGVPIFNEERFLDASLASLRAQDYPNLEIILSDNASTDRSIAICERHAAEDPRISILRSAKNLGATANFEKLVAPARGRYFMWAAGHDLWTPNYISECATLLQSHTEACIASGSSRWIGVEGEALVKESGWTDTRGMTRVARFFTIFWGNMHPILGLMRTADVRACLPLQSITGSDLVFLSAMTIRGDFVHAPNCTWSRREFRAELDYSDKLRRYATPTYALSRTRFQRIFPLVQLPWALMGLVVRSRFTLVEKAGTVLALITAFPVRYLVGRRGRSS